MSTKILFVDDDTNILAAYTRQFHRQYTLDTAVSGVEGLKRIQNDGPYAVILADMRMPNMNGIEFLRKTLLLAPESTRMMLTGNADMETAIEAVNEGHIFRFLTKPCSPETMQQSLSTGVRQYHLVTGEREMMEKTLLGSIGILTDILATVDTLAFRRAQQLRERVREIAPVVQYPHRWELELAALLSQLGHLKMPGTIQLKERQEEDLTAQELATLAQIPEIGYRLLARIPRLEAVAQIVRFQAKKFAGGGPPPVPVANEHIPRGSRILKILIDFQELEAQGKPPVIAFRIMRNHSGWYDPELLETIATHYQAKTLSPAPGFAPRFF